VCELFLQRSKDASSTVCGMAARWLAKHRSADSVTAYTGMRRVGNSLIVSDCAGALGTAMAPSGEALVLANGVISS
jgi:hypothetical protein